MANCFACAQVTNCCASSTCMKPVARVFGHPPNMFARCCLSHLATARSATPGPTSTTGPSLNCRELHRADSWRVEPHFRQARAAPVNSPDNANILRIFVGRLDISSVAVQRSVYLGIGTNSEVRIILRQAHLRT